MKDCMWKEVGEKIAAVFASALAAPAALCTIIIFMVLRGMESVRFRKDGCAFKKGEQNTTEVKRQP